MKKLAVLLLALLSFTAHASLKDTREITCLAENIYHEARGEPIGGQAMVAYTTINRVKDKRWRSTICKVVHQPNQFSWTLNINTIAEHKAYDNSLAIAELIYQNYKYKPDEEIGDGVNHYLRCDWRHKVKWWRKMKFIDQIGNHCFYKG